MGRIVTSSEGFPERIVEHHEATPDQKEHALANAGIYKVDRELLRQFLESMIPNPHSGEYYLTDLVAYAHRHGFKTHLLEGAYDDFHGINTRHDLAMAENILQNRWRKRAMEQGATLVDPSTVFFSHDTHISSDCRIEPFVTFGGNVHLTKNVHVRSFCHLEETTLHPFSEVGPFAHLRGGTVLHSHAQVGNFC